MRILSSLLTGVLALTLVSAASAQVPGLGFNPEGVFQHGDVDSVNLQNFNATIRIPLFSLPQRGSLKSIDYDLFANTNIWTPVFYPDGGSTPTGNYTGTYSWLGPAFNIPQFVTYGSADNSYIGTDGTQYDASNDWIQDAGGGMHALVVDASSVASPNTQANAIYRTVDGSGYIVPNSSSSLSLLDSSGRQLMSGGYPGIVDPDGNTIAATDGATWLYAPPIIDTVGRTITAPDFYPDFWHTQPTASSRCPTTIADDTQPLLTSVDWTVPGVGSTTQTYTICFAVIYIRTNMWQYGGQMRVESYCDYEGDCGGEFRWSEFVTPVTVIQSVVLPN